MGRRKGLGEVWWALRTLPPLHWSAQGWQLRTWPLTACPHVAALWRLAEVMFMGDFVELPDG